jgi:hypothetical protein
MNEHDPQRTDATEHRSRYRQLLLVALETAVQLAARTRDALAGDDDEIGLGALHGKVRAFADQLAAIIHDPHGGGDGQRELGELRAALAASVPRTSDLPAV